MIWAINPEPLVLRLNEILSAIRSPQSSKVVSCHTHWACKVAKPVKQSLSSLMNSVSGSHIKVGENRLLQICLLTSRHTIGCKKPPPRTSYAHNNNLRCFLEKFKSCHRWLKRQLSEKKMLVTQESEFRSQELTLNQTLGPDGCL